MKDGGNIPRVILTLLCSEKHDLVNRKCFDFKPMGTFFCFVFLLGSDCVEFPAVNDAPRTAPWTHHGCILVCVTCKIFNLLSVNLKVIFPRSLPVTTPLCLILTTNWSQKKTYHPTWSKQTEAVQTMGHVVNVGHFRFRCILPGPDAKSVICHVKKCDITSLTLNY